MKSNSVSFSELHRRVAWAWLAVVALFGLYRTLLAAALPPWRLAGTR